MRATTTFLLANCLAWVPSVGFAQTTPDAGATLGRDVVAPRTGVNRGPATVPLPDGGTVATPSGESGGIFVGRVNIDGVSTIQPESFSAVTLPFVGKTLATDGLQKLARSVADEARARGYIFASAAIPEQDVEQGEIRVLLNEGSVDEVRITGSDNSKLRSILNRIVGPAALKSVVERQLLLAEDLPGISIVETRYLREGQRGILAVTAKEDRLSGSVRLDNNGSKSFGPVRMSLDLAISDLILAGDELSVQVTGTPAAARELIYITTSYSVPIGASGARLGVTTSAGRTQPGDIPGGILKGLSRYAAVNASYPLIRGNDSSLWVSAELSYLNVDTRVFGLLLQRDDLVTMNISAYGNTKLGGGRLSAGLGFVRGLGVLGANSAGDPFSSRDDASGQFKKFTGWFNWIGPIGGNFSLRIQGNGQIATTPLLSPQELGLGGPGFGRGYDFSERFGDGGVLGAIELRHDFSKPVRHIDWAQVYGFVDGGYVYNLKDGFGGGSLLSAGGGVRAGAGRFEIGAEAAFPISDPRFDGGKSPRFNLSLGYSF